MSASGGVVLFARIRVAVSQLSNHDADTFNLDNTPNS